MLTVGDAGTLIRTDISANTAKLLPSHQTDDLNDVVFKSATPTALFCGDNGALVSLTNPNTSSNCVNLTSTSNENLNGISIAANKVYLVGDNGTALFSYNYASSAFSSLLGYPSGNLQSVDISSSLNEFVIVGSGSHIYNGFMNYIMPNVSVFIPELFDFSFIDNKKGYVVGDNYTLRYTDDGGATWELCIPPLGFSSGVPEINAVEYISANKALVFGKNLHQAEWDESTFVSSSDLVTGLEIRDVEFSNSDNGLLVGKNAGAKAYRTIDGGDNWVSITVSSQYNSVHALGVNSHYVAVGESGVAGAFNTGSGTHTSLTNVNSGVHFHDIHFTDVNTAYVVGEKGKMYRGSSISYVNGGVTSISWAQLFANELGSNTSNKLYCMDFVNPNLGFIGGELSGSPSTNLAQRVEFEEINSSYYYYDHVGRLVVSQNVKQYNNFSGRMYSYTLFDELGRIVEVGQKLENTTQGELRFKDVFGTLSAHGEHPDVIDDYKLAEWINGSGVRTEVTQSFYDEVVSGVSVPITQENLRNRVVMVSTESMYDGNDNSYNHATHYSYDIHGNVNALLQHNPLISESSQRNKLITYAYDLISGNVNRVNYQEGERDAFYHKYAYDADNRLLEVFTSDNKVNWDMDAKYIYYDHGPLARVELGQNNVQGVDYAYTLQGWLKGVNSNVMGPNTDRDIGHDGYGSGPNASFARDIMGFTLGYYNTQISYDGGTTYVTAADFKDIGGTNPSTKFEASTVGSNVEAARHNLFNGNIGHMVTTICDVSPTLQSVQINRAYGSRAQAMSYKYDQLNRLVYAVGFDDLNHATNAWMNGATTANRYRNNFTYDGNGNIETQVRYDQQGVLIDDLKYHYQIENSQLTRNRLYHHNDISADSRTGELEQRLNTGADAFDATVLTINTNNNYGYDELGNLERDDWENIKKITWRADGKISSIDRSISTSKNLVFDYDAMGNRIAKHVYIGGSFAAVDLEKTIYYIRDATGNVMATYEQTEPVPSQTSIKLIERPIYGSDRLGLYQKQVEMITSVPVNGNYVTHPVGERHYELKNHLGNVLTIITDQRLMLDNDADGIVDYTLPVGITSMDYTPFGAKMTERTFVDYDYSLGDYTYRYGFNGQEKDDEVSGGGNSYAARNWQYDPRLGRRWNVDPIDRVNVGSYTCLGNNPIIYIDPLGLDWYRNLWTGELRWYESTNLVIRKPNTYQVLVSLGSQLGVGEATMYSPLAMGVLTIMGGMVKGFDNGGKFSSTSKIAQYGKVGENNSLMLNDNFPAEEFFDLMVGSFITGTGFKEYHFGPNSRVSSEMRGSKLFSEAIDFYLSDEYKGENFERFRLPTNLDHVLTEWIDEPNKLGYGYATVTHTLGTANFSFEEYKVDGVDWVRITVSNYHSVASATGANRLGWVMGSEGRYDRPQNTGKPQPYTTIKQVIVIEMKKSDLYVDPNKKKN